MRVVACSAYLRVFFRAGTKKQLIGRIEAQRAAGKVTPAELAEKQDGDEELPELQKLSGSDGPYVPCDGTNSEVSNKMAALVAVYDPDFNNELGSNEEPFYHCFFVDSADTAIYNAYFGKKDVCPGGITKFAILGYSMLAAGLTVQSVLNTEDGIYNFCPQYVALATAETAPLDTQLQIAGRSFVELKEADAPAEWQIQLLGVKGMVDRLKNYSGMEEVLANIKGLRMFEALKKSFDADFMTQNSVGTLGVIGTRRSDFGSILGLTPELAAAKSAAVAARREARMTAKRRVEQEQQTEQLCEEEAGADWMEPDAEGVGVE